ncbi:MAG: ATP-grasp domain-containing protein [Pelolinea sp.]|nr:ATP-grasp domain-containing protein [Pelolinea sp.]
MNILIPSAGRRYLHIKYTRECEGVGKVITTDIDFLSPGIHAADKCYRVPLSTDPKYLDTILEICKKEDINFIIPLLDLDILLFSRNRTKFEKEGIGFLLSPESTIEMALDKLSTAQFLSENGLPGPVTMLPISWSGKNMPYPILIKPRFPALRVQKGYDITVIRNDDDMKKVKTQITGIEDNYVFQEYLTGTELSIDFFCQANGDYVMAIPAERISALTTAFSKNGGTMDKGLTFHDENIDNLVKKATVSTKFFGPANFGGYRSENGKVQFTEINARFTGGATLAVKGSGIDLFQWSVYLLSGKEIIPPENGFEEIVMTSYVEPIFFKKDSIFFDEI